MRYRWPEGNHCAVVLSFDVDAESGYVFRHPEEAASRLDEMEERRFGVRTGLPRILRLLERYRLPATFFVPGYTIEHHTAAVRTIVDAGYELGCHGNIHEAVHTLDEAAERRILREQVDIFQRTFGLRPVGYRSPSWSLNVRSPALLEEFGFDYDSSLMGDDVPYFLDTPHGRHDQSSGYQDGSLRGCARTQRRNCATSASQAPGRCQSDTRRRPPPRDHRRSVAFAPPGPHPQMCKRRVLVPGEREDVGASVGRWR